MNIKKNRFFVICVLSFLMAVCQTGCNNSAGDNGGKVSSETVSISESAAAESKESVSFETVSVTVNEMDNNGDVGFDIDEIDLEYGDSVNISFSGGYELKGIPYYPDFYGKRGSAILTDHFDNLCVAGIGCSFNKTANIQMNETAIIDLDEKGKYKTEFDAYNISDGKTRIEGQTDEEYLNARCITAGSIKAGRLYRSASPFDAESGRAGQMGEYLKEHQINCILDLFDTEERLASYKDLPEYTASLLESGKVIISRVGIDLLEADAMQTIGKGLTALAGSDGPYLIHCSLGRDRTGVISAILELICGASYTEVIDDYMLSYDYLHKIDMDPSSLQYKLFK